MKVYLVRHGSAETTSTGRPLSEYGRAQARAMADFLAKAGVRVDEVWHSDKTRAAETARILAGAVAGVLATERPGLRPNDPIEPLIAALENEPRDLMLVGHLPFMAHCVSALTCRSSSALNVSFGEACVACVERPGRGAWYLRWMIAPSLLLSR